MYKRINVSIDEDVLKTIDGAAKMKRMTRSEFLEYLYFEYSKCRVYARELNAEIERCETYEQRRELKADSFYKLYGFLGA